MNDLIDLTPYDLKVGGYALGDNPDDPGGWEPGHPIVAMTHGVSADLHRGGYCGVDAQAEALRRFLGNAYDTAEDGEPQGNLFEIPMTLVDKSGALETELWVKQNHPYDQYIVLWPREY